MKPLSFTEVRAHGGCARAIASQREGGQGHHATIQQSSAKQLGIIAHRAMELAIDRGWPDSFDIQSWEALWHEARREEVGDDVFLSNEVLARIGVSRWLDAPSSKVLASADASAELELEVGGVFGIIDLVTVDDAGSVRLWDLKTSLAEPARWAAGTSAALEQLTLYGALYEEHFGIRPEQVGLITLNRRAEPIAFDPARARELIDSYRSILAATEDPDPPTAPGDACASCGLLASCVDGINHAQSLPGAAHGTLSAVPERTTIGLRVTASVDGTAEVFGPIDVRDVDQVFEKGTRIFVLPAARGARCRAIDLGELERGR